MCHRYVTHANNYYLSYDSAGAKISQLNDKGKQARDCKVQTRKAPFPTGVRFGQLHMGRHFSTVMPTLFPTNVKSCVYVCILFPKFQQYAEQIKTCLCLDIVSNVKQSSANQEQSFQ